MEGRRILLIEDNPDDEILIRAALKDAKITNQIDVMRDGEEALDFLFRREKYANLDKNRMPEVVLLDLKLPKIDGLDILRAIRANEDTKRLPVVILTSSKEESDLIACYDSGANSYVVKPIKRLEFEKAIAQVGLYWLIVNSTPSELV